jgi:hypothetical protein
VLLRLYMADVSVRQCVRRAKVEGKKMKMDWDEFELTRGEFKHDGKDRMERSD